MSYTVVPMYNLNKSVGPGCPNQKTDVMLIQFMLAMMCMNSGWPAMAFIPMWVNPNGFAAIYPMDGVYKPELANWIKQFQNGANRTGYGPLFADGKVNSSKVAWGNKSIKQSSMYTIQVMNKMLFQASSTLFLKLPEHAWMPGPLKAELTQLRLASDLFPA